MAPFKLTSCRMCHAQIRKIEQCFMHDLLKIPICQKCHLFYKEGDWEFSEDGTSNYCNFCAEGGTLLPCDDENCTNVFCFECLEKSLPVVEYQNIIENCEKEESEDEGEDAFKWFCLICKPSKKLKHWQHEMDGILELQNDGDENGSGDQKVNENGVNETTESIDSEVERIKEMKRKLSTEKEPRSPLLNGNSRKRPRSHLNSENNISQTENSKSKFQSSSQQQKYEEISSNKRTKYENSPEMKIPDSLITKKEKNTTLPEEIVNLINFSDTSVVSVHTDDEDTAECGTQKTNEVNASDTSIISIISINSEKAIPDEQSDFLKNLHASGMDDTYKTWILEQIELNRRFKEKNQKIEKINEKSSISRQFSCSKDSQVTVIEKNSASSVNERRKVAYNKLKEQNKKYKTALQQVKDKVQERQKSIVDENGMPRIDSLSISNLSPSHEPIQNGNMSDIGTVAKTSPEYKSRLRRGSKGEEMKTYENETSLSRKKSARKMIRERREKETQSQGSTTSESDIERMNGHIEDATPENDQNIEEQNEELVEVEHEEKIGILEEEQAGKMAEDEKQEDPKKEKPKQSSKSKPKLSKNQAQKRISGRRTRSKDENNRKSLKEVNTSDTFDDQDALKLGSEGSEKSGSEKTGSEKSGSDAEIDDLENLLEDNKSDESESKSKSAKEEEDQEEESPTKKQSRRNLVTSNKRNLRQPSKASSKNLEEEEDNQQEMNFSNNSNSDSDEEEEMNVIRRSRRVRKDKQETVDKLKQLKKRNREELPPDSDPNPIFSEGENSNLSNPNINSNSGEEELEEEDDEQSTRSNSSETSSGEDEQKKVKNKLKALNRKFRSSDEEDEETNKPSRTTRATRAATRQNNKSKSIKDAKKMSKNGKTDKEKVSLFDDEESDTESAKKKEKHEQNGVLKIDDSSDERDEQKSKKKQPSGEVLCLDSDSSNFQPPTPTSTQENDSDKENRESGSSKTKKMHPFFKNSKNSSKNKTDDVDSTFNKTLNSSLENAALPKFRQRGKNKNKAEKGRDKTERKERKKKVRKILDRDGLAATTKTALQEEEDRRDRLTALNNKALENMDDDDSSDADPENTKKTKKTYIDINSQVYVDPGLAKYLKPHQVDAIRFMFDNFYESLNRVEKTLESYDKQEDENDEPFKHEGKGCIIAHCMGLGKTFSTIAFLHTVMNHVNLSSEMIGKTCLVMCPKNVFQNWQDEINKWCKKGPKDQRFPIFMFPSGGRDRDKAKVNELKLWRKKGGVMIMTFDQFKLHVMLAHDKEIEKHLQEIPGQYRKKKKKRTGKKPKKIQKSLRQAFITALLDPGPDIVVLDEAHIIRNQESDIHTCVSLISTQRRLALTGTPMQNNLEEYYWMCNFCKPNLLGTVAEFKNQYSITIQRGQRKDATERDVELMREFSSLLYTILKDTVHRRDEGVLKAMLPEKVEYLLCMRLTPVQEKLYSRYMEIRGFGNQFLTKTDAQVRRIDNDMMAALRANMKAGLFSDKLKLETLCFHPGLLQKQIEEQAEDDETDSMEDFIDDPTDEDEEDDASSTRSYASKASKNSKVSKGSSSKSNSMGTTDSLFILEKSLEELEAYCNLRLPLFKKVNTTKTQFELPAINEIYDQIMESQDLGQTRRLAYGFFYTAAGKIDFPHYFESAKKPADLNMNDPEVRARLEMVKHEKTSQMRTLLIKHFTASLTKELQRMPTQPEVDSRINAPEVRDHSNQQIEAQLKTEFNKMKKQANREASSRATNFIETAIKEDAKLKAKQDAVKWFKDEEIGYHYDPDCINIELGSKLNFALKLVNFCEREGEKVVLASQRMDVLDQLELCLRQITLETKDKKNRRLKKKSNTLDSDEESQSKSQSKSQQPGFTHVGKW